MPGGGSSDEPNDTTFTASNATVDAEVSVWTITPDAIDPNDFLASTTSGLVKVEATGGGNRNPAGSNFTSSVAFSLGVSEVANFSFDMTYFLDQSGSNAGSPSLSWSLVNTTTGGVVFNSSDTVASGSSVSISTLSGTLVESGDYVLEIKGELTGPVNGSNKTSEARLDSVSFDVDVTVPEPSSLTLWALALGICLGRKRAA